MTASARIDGSAFVRQVRRHGRFGKSRPKRPETLVGGEGSVVVGGAGGGAGTGVISRVWTN